MGTLVGLLELSIFLLLARKVLKKREYMIECLIFCFVCDILNYKLFDSLPWTNIGISLYSSDYLVILMVLVLLLGHYNIPKAGFSVFMLLFSVMAIQSAVRGTIAYGMTSDFFADLRKYLYFSVTTMYFFMVPIGRNFGFYEKKLDRMFDFLTIYTLFLLCFFFMGMPLGTRGSERPLLAQYAIIYASYTSIKWYEDLCLSKEKKIKIRTLIYTLTIVLNRFNTTWVALGIAIGILLIYKIIARKKGLLSVKFWFQIVTIGILVVVIFIRFQDTAIIQNLMSFAEKFDTSQDTTYTSRMDVWAACMATVKGTAMAIGFPFGSGFYVPYRGGVWPTVPHSGYIETLMRTGYPGVFFLVGAVLLVIISSMKKKNILPVMACTICLVYWYTYGITLYQGVIIGVAAQFVYKYNKKCLASEESIYD